MQELNELKLAVATEKAKRAEAEADKLETQRHFEEEIEVRDTAARPSVGEQKRIYSEFTGIARDSRDICRIFLFC